MTSGWVSKNNTKQINKLLNRPDKITSDKRDVTRSETITRSLARGRYQSINRSIQREPSCHHIRKKLTEETKGTIRQT